MIHIPRTLSSSIRAPRKPGAATRTVRSALLVLIGFLLGMLTTQVQGAIGYLQGAAWQDGWQESWQDVSLNAWQSTPDGNYEQPEGNALTGAIVNVAGVPERASPRDRIPERDIGVYKDRVVISVKDAQWSTFTDTNSMDPVIDAGANAIQVVPESADEIQVGDIISYRSEYAGGIFIHRVVHKGQDERGTYFIAKGDNLPTSDPGKIRFEQIERVVVAIIY